MLDANAAAGQDIIDAAGVTGTITLQSALPTLTEGVSIRGSGQTEICGAGQTGGFCISGDNQFRVFEIVQSGGNTNRLYEFENLTVTDGALTGNLNGAGIGATSNAGTLNVNLTKVRIKDCTNNNFIGGGLHVINTIASVTDSFIHDNHALFDGGGILVGASSTMTVDSSEITGNTVERQGAGIASSSILIVRNSTISGNNVNGTGSGGGIWAGGTVRIENSTISGNGMVRTGGGIHLNAQAGYFSNVTISGNSASGQGGGIYFNSGTHVLRNVTIANNSITGSTVGQDTGGGIFSAGSDVTIANTLIADNGAPGDEGNEVAGTGGTEIDTRGTNLIRDSILTVTLNVINGSNITGTDPDLEALKDNGGFTKTHALAPGSVAIDNADNAEAFDTADPPVALTTDQRGVNFERIVNGTVDIGAYEIYANKSAPFDFDGDRKTDVSIFRPGPPAQWWWLRSSDGGNNAAQFGVGVISQLVPRDYTGDGRTDIAFWRESTGEWFILRSEDGTFYSFPFGSAGDIAAPGDFDGDFQADAAVYRPSTGTWFINRSSDGGTTIEAFGISEDRPVVADYDGDEQDDIAIFRPSVSQWWIRRSTAGDIAYQFLAFGPSNGDKTVQGDYTGDCKADVAIYRPSTGEWFVLRSEDGTFYSFPFGANGDIAAPGDYDGDGSFDATVFRPSINNWFKFQSTNGFEQVPFGQAGDVPLPSVYSIP